MFTIEMAMWGSLAAAILFFLLDIRGVLRRVDKRVDQGFDRSEAHFQSMRPIVGEMRRNVAATAENVSGLGETMVRELAPIVAKRDHLRLVSDESDAPLHDEFSNDPKVTPMRISAWARRI
jgi:hypothetical protein